MYQRFDAFDISPIHSFGVSIEFITKLTLLSDTEIGNTDIAKIVTGRLLLGPAIFMME